MSSAEPITPTYSAVALCFAEPMRYGDGRRLMTDPTQLSCPEAPVVFANVMLLSGIYYITGPAFPADGEHRMREAVVAGKAAIEAHNTQQLRGQRIYTARNETESLFLIWNLLAAHHCIKDAAAQVQQHELRQATDRHQAEEDSRAALELAQLGTTLEAAQREVEVCLSREATERRSYRNKQSEARVAFTSSQARRDEYCAPAKAAVQRAIDNTTAAKEKLVALEAGDVPGN